MLLRRFAENDLFSSLKDMQRIQNQLDRLLSASASSGSLEFPPTNVWTSEEGAIVRSEIPGIEPERVDISLVNNTLTIRGSRGEEVLKEGQSCHRQERESGHFTRTLQLPFNVNSDRVEARFCNGVLEITLPRAEAEKPRKISVVTE
ncbi:MAG: Hsp20/alpha crystallin family protein [Candidatus Melainabacteria bacterium]|nr:Hsp20/alpha crystallin family protein [Candidatus Melainabacteria bacterium]